MFEQHLSFFLRINCSVSSLQGKEWATFAYMYVYMPLLFRISKLGGKEKLGFVCYLGLSVSSRNVQMQLPDACMWVRKERTTGSSLCAHTHASSHYIQRDMQRPQPSTSAAVSPPQRSLQFTAPPSRHLHPDPAAAAAPPCPAPAAAPAGPPSHAAAAAGTEAATATATAAALLLPSPSPPPPPAPRRTKSAAPPWAGAHRPSSPAPRGRWAP